MQSVAGVYYSLLHEHHSLFMLQSVIEAVDRTKMGWIDLRECHLVLNIQRNNCYTGKYRGEGD